jgi:trigger factor
VKIGDLATAEIERASAEVTTRRSTSTWTSCASSAALRPARASAPAEDGDRVTVDFEGKIDGEPFEGGKAEDFLRGRRRPDAAGVRDRRARPEGGREQDLPAGLSGRLPRQGRGGQDGRLHGHGQEDRGAHLPEVNEHAKSLGVEGGTVEGLRADIKKNLEREIKFRLNARNKQAVMDALLAKSELDVPKASVQAEVDRLVESARRDLKRAA